MKCMVCHAECVGSICPTCGFSQNEMPNDPEMLQKWISSIIAWRTKYWQSLTDFKIDGTTLVEYTGTGGRVTVPYGITRIGDDAFANKGFHQKLWKVDLPETVTEIGERAFFASTVEYIDFPEGLEVIEDRAFWTSSLRYLSTPFSCKRIGNASFMACHELRNIFLHEGLESVGNEAFVRCKQVDFIRLPTTLKHVGIAAFSTGGRVPEKLINASETQRFRFVDKVLMDTEEHKLISGYNNSSIPDGGSVWEIGKKAFSDCDSLPHVVIPESVSYIGDCAFRDCEHLRTLAFKERLPLIGFQAFHPDIKTLVFLPENADDSQPYLPRKKYTIWDWELHQGYSEIIILDTNGLKVSLHEYWYDFDTEEFHIEAHCSNDTNEERFFYLENIRFDWVDCPIVPVCSVPPKSDTITAWTIPAEYAKIISSDPDIYFSVSIRVAKSERLKRNPHDILSPAIHYFPVRIGE